MADQTLHSMTQNTSPVATDELYLLDDPAGTPANNRITVRDLIGYGGMQVSVFGKVAGALADSTTYYFGSDFSGGDMGTVAARRMTWMTRGGTITKMYGHVFNAGTLSSGEDGTLSIRLNNTTDYSVSTTVETNGTTTNFSNIALAVPVSAGDYIEVKFQTPAYGTNPSAVSLFGQLFIK